MKFSNIQGVLGVLVLLAGPGAADETHESQAQGCNLLPDQQRSTIVLYEPSSGRKLICNDLRSREQFVPASTFKIPHTIIAFETGVVVDEHEKFRWDGRSRGIPAWDRSLSITEAVPASAVWVFQDIAKKVGYERESAWIQKIQYGNSNIGTIDDINHFWLSGPLKISAVEQVEFLHLLQSKSLDAQLPALEKTINILKLNLDGYSNLYGKTGAMLPINDEGFLRSFQTELLPPDTEHTGWFVGWVDRNYNDGGPVFFALNIDLDVENALKIRVPLTLSILEINGFSAK